LNVLTNIINPTPTIISSETSSNTPRTKTEYMGYGSNNSKVSVLGIYQLQSDIYQILDVSVSGNSYLPMTFSITDQKTIIND